jgi:hypothetical protein
VTAVTADQPPLSHCQDLGGSGSDGGIAMEHAQGAHSDAAVKTAPKAEDRGRDLVPLAEERSPADLSRIGLVLCFASAVLTLIGIGSALERVFF